MRPISVPQALIVLFFVTAAVSVGLVVFLNGAQDPELTVTAEMSATTTVGTAYIQDAGRWWYVSNSTMLNDTMEFLSLKAISPSSQVLIVQELNSTGQNPKWVMLMSK